MASRGASVGLPLRRGPQPSPPQIRRFAGTEEPGRHGLRQKYQCGFAGAKEQRSRSASRPECSRRNMALELPRKHSRSITFIRGQIMIGFGSRTDAAPGHHRLRPSIQSALEGTWRMGPLERKRIRVQKAIRVHLRSFAAKIMTRLRIATNTAPGHHRP